MLRSLTLFMETNNTLSNGRLYTTEVIPAPAAKADIGGAVAPLHLRTSNICRTKFIDDIKESNDSLGISYILTDNKLSLVEKQLKIENYIFNNWVDSLLKKVNIKDNSKLFSSNIGLDLLKYCLQRIDSTLSEYKNSKKYSKKKLYFNFIKLL